MSSCRIERNILSAVLIGERDHVGFLAVDLGGCRQLAVAAVGNIDGHNMVCPVVVQACSLNAPKPCCLVLNCSFGNYFLNRELEVLAAIGLGKGVSRDLCHHIGNALGAIIRVGELLVAVSKKCRRSIVFAFNNEVEFSSLHVAAGQSLFNLNAVIRAARCVLVGERYRTIRIGHLGLERTGMVVGHRHLHRLGAAIELHAFFIGSRNSLTLPRGLIHVEGVFARLGKAHLIEAEALRFIGLGTRYGCRTGQRHSARCYRTLRGIVCSGKLEAKGFAVCHVAARQSLGAVNDSRCSGGRIAVAEAEHGRIAFAWGSGEEIVAVLSIQNKRIVVVLDRYRYRPDGSVVLHTRRIKTLVGQNVSHSTPFAVNLHYFNDLVFECRFMRNRIQIVEGKRCLRERNAAVRLYFGERTIPRFAFVFVHHRLCARLLWQRSFIIGRAGNYMEHARFKRTGTSSVRVQLFTKWSPFHLLGVVFVYELRNISNFRVVQLHAIVGKFLGQLGSNRQLAGVVFVGNGHNNLIQRSRCAHARIQYAE